MLVLIYFVYKLFTFGFFDFAQLIKCIFVYSYTSKASFLDNDFIPVYKKEDRNYEFSGKRFKRGLYKSKDKIIINDDLNGSANIGCARGDRYGH